MILANEGEALATSPVPQWAQEMSPTHHGPTGAGVFRLAVLAIIIAICWSFFTTEGGASQVDRKSGVSFCDEHKGDPAWDSICAETKRLRGR